MGSLREREVACSASHRQGSNFESCVWRTVSSQSFHHPQEVLLAQFSLYVHKGGLKPDSFRLMAVIREKRLTYYNFIILLMCSKLIKTNNKSFNQNRRLSSYGCYLCFARISLVVTMLDDIPSLSRPFCTHIFVYFLYTALLLFK